MPKEKDHHLALDEETRRELGYAGAGINSPGSRDDDGSRLIRSRQNVPLPRRDMMKVEAFYGPGEEIFDRLCTGIPRGQVSEDMSDEYQALIKQLDAYSFPIGDVPRAPHVQAQGTDRTAAYLLVKQLLRVGRGKAARCEHIEALAATFRAFFGFEPAQAWIQPLVDALRAAALERLNWDRRLTKLSDVQRAPFAEPALILEHAKQVLGRGRKAMERWPTAIDFPAWVEEKLVASLIPRFGFDGKGGGPSRVISQASIVRLLATPALMIRDLEKSPDGAARWKDTIALLESELGENG